MWLSWAVIALNLAYVVLGAVAIVVVSGIVGQILTTEGHGKHRAHI